MKYDVDADLYEGPLPLLVELAKLNLVDVFLVKLVDLTRQYLHEVKTSSHNLNDLSEPLPLLGQLVALKSRGLLPQAPGLGEEEEVPVSLEELERRLKEYDQFKTVAQLLSELHVLQHKHFTRTTDAADLLPAEPDAAPAPFEASLGDLMGAFTRVLEKATAPVYEVRVEPWTVEMKVEELRMQLHVRRQIRFSELFSPEKSKFELVVTFLALLELIRQRVARALQEQQFSEIVVALRVEASLS
jgi:segregation and condensation protein A